MPLDDFKVVMLGRVQLREEDVNEIEADGMSELASFILFEVFEVLGELGDAAESLDDVYFCLELLKFAVFFLGLNHEKGVFLVEIFAVASSNGFA